MPDVASRRARVVGLAGLIAVLAFLAVSARVAMVARDQRASLERRVEWLNVLQPHGGVEAKPPQVAALEAIAHDCADCSAQTRVAATRCLAAVPRVPDEVLAPLSGALRTESRALSRSLTDGWTTLELVLVGAALFAIGFYVLLKQSLDRARAAAAVLRSLEREAAQSAAAYRTIQAEQAFAEGFFAMAPIGLQVYDASGTLLRVNAAQARIIGVANAQVGVGQYNGLTAPFAIASGSAALFARAAAGEVVEQPGRRLDLGVPSNEWQTRKTTLVVDQVLFPVRDASGRVTHVIQANHDVTEVHQQRERLAAAERLATVGTLAAGVAHEINNPLAYISSNISWLEGCLRERQHDLPPDLSLRFTESLRDAQDGVTRVQAIVRDLGTLSGPGREGMGRVVLADALAPALRILDHEIRYRARVVDRVDPSCALRVDPQALGQVLLNLIQNAAHAIAPGDPARHSITFSNEQLPDGRVRITVADTGRGISPELAAHIFDPFFTTKPLGQGTGLGLSVCRGLVQRMGGELTFESVPNESTRFFLDLPGAPSLEPVPVGEAAAPPERRLRLLFVDDEPLFARAIQRQLRSVADVVAAASGREAMALVHADDAWDGILLDVMMPDMDGPAVLDALRQTAPGLVARVILMSGGAFSARGTALWSTFTGPKLTKPFDTSALVAALRSVSESQRT